MIRVCNKCGKEFDGYKVAHFCPICRKEIQVAAAKEYYRKNRDAIRMKQKAYQANLHLGPKTHDKPQYDTSGWTIELIRKGDLWTWKATKGKAVLKAGREFESISIAKKDCLLALG